MRMYNFYYYGIVAPSLIKVEYNHYTFKNGQKVRLVCPLYGIPTPSIKWSRNGSRVSTQKEPDADGHHIYKTKASLVISRIKPSDSGIYVCTAKNKVGKSSFNFTIRVQGSFHDQDLTFEHTIYILDQTILSQ